MRAARYILALDQGTTSSRAILFDRDGEPVASAQAGHGQRYPQPGWVEHEPEDLWESSFRSSGGVAGGPGPDIAAIGIANQRETTVLGTAADTLGNAIVWQDRRTAGACDRL